jgi:hypothetical protein
MSVINSDIDMQRLAQSRAKRREAAERELNAIILSPAEQRTAKELQRLDELASQLGIDDAALNDRMAAPALLADKLRQIFPDPEIQQAKDDLNAATANALATLPAIAAKALAQEGHAGRLSAIVKGIVGECVPEGAKLPFLDEIDEVMTPIHQCMDPQALEGRNSIVRDEVRRLRAKFPFLVE